MAVDERLRHLLDVLPRLCLREPPVGLILQDLVHLPAGGELQDEVDPGLVVEVAEHPEDVGVPQVALDLDLAAELVLDLEERQENENASVASIKSVSPPPW